MQLGELYTELTVKDSKFKKGMRNARKEIKSTGQSLLDFKTKALLVFAGVAIAVNKAVRVMGHFVGRASDVEEQASKFKAVFKEQEGAAQAFAETLSKSTGRSVYALKDFLASLQDTFVPLGFARDRARELSQQLVKLGVDVASFQNKSEPEVMNDFQSALVGNHETVRKYGIIITQAALNQELMTMGIKKGVKAATEQEKVQARLNIILKGTTDAQGDAERTASSFANVVKQLWAKIDELAVEIGRVLVPFVKELIVAIEPIIKQLRDWINQNAELLKNFARLAASNLVAIFKAIGKAVEFIVHLFNEWAPTFERVISPLIRAAEKMGLLADESERAAKATAEIAKNTGMVGSGGGGVQSEGPAALAAKAGITLGPGETYNPATGGVSRAGFSAPKRKNQLEPTGFGGKIEARSGGFTGIADLAKNLQQAVFDRERKRDQQKIININEKQLKTLEDVRDALKERGVGVAIS